MRTSCRFAMAVHVLAILAYKEGDRVTSAGLAGSINTHPVIVRRLLQSLKKAKLVDICKGVGAGSRLGRAPSRINMAEIYRSVEDCESFATPSNKPSAVCPVGNHILEALAKVFVSAQTAMEKDLEKTTLADVLDMLKGSGKGARKKVI